MLSPEIASFVFVDLETTGLLGRGQKPKITELCMISVQREEMITTSKFPRVTNKLQICFNPSKMISPGASLITGLFNDSLESQGTFDAGSMHMINSFLQRLPQPVCLLAHNGKNFDFRILVAESDKTKVPFLDSLLCADTLEAFRTFDTEAYETSQFMKGTITQQELERTPQKPTQASSSLQPKRKSFDEISGHNLDISEKDTNKVKKRLKFNFSRSGTPNVTPNGHMSSNSNSNGTQVTTQVGGVTPDFSNQTNQPKRTMNSHENGTNNVSDVNVQTSGLIQSSDPDILTDEQLLAGVLEIEQKSPSTNNTCASRSTGTDDKCDNTCRHDFSPVTGTNNKSNYAYTQEIFKDRSYVSPRSTFGVSYKLDEIYKRTFGSKPPVSHTAECDVVSMIDVCRAASSNFLAWTDNNAVLFSTVMPAYF